ncbi:GFA family protein [Roseinatronobacter sp.]
MTDVTCACGQVALTLSGKPILSAECLCSDCQQAAVVFQALPDACPVVDDKGATRFVLYRKDRVRCDRGQEFLAEHRLTDASTTRRVIATCCNTPMFLDLTQGHWLSIYGALWPKGALPKLDLRTMTKHAPAGVVLPDDVPNPKTHNASFFARLILAWAAMGFRVPPHDYVKGKLDAR